MKVKVECTGAGKKTLHTYKYSIYRINMLLTLFRSEHAIYTIEELSDMLKVPRNVIREDIYLLGRGVDECETVIFPYDDEEDDENFLSRLKKGECDSSPLGAYSRFRSDIFLPLSRKELSVLSDFAPDRQLDMRFAEDGVYIKPSPYRESDEVILRVEALNEYIRKGATLQIRYELRDGNIRELKYKPLCIVRYNLENTSYVLSIENGKIFPIRVDRIRSMKEIEGRIEISDYSPLKKLPFMWKMDNSEEIEVKIKIMGTPHIRSKIRNEIFNMRISYESMLGSKLAELLDDFDKAELGSITEYKDYDIFEGKIIGYSAFRNWVNGYGSAIIVEKPLSLRNEIIESLKKRCNNYSD